MVPEIKAIRNVKVWKQECINTPHFTQTHLS